MKSFLVALSLALNAVLLVVIASASRRSLPAPSAPLKRDVTHCASPEITTLDSTSVSVAGLEKYFNWSMLESTNYQVYRDNLRRIGCPDSTLADIIAGDVNAHYLDRVDVVAHSVGREFWELMADGENLWKRIEDRAETLKELSKERDTVLEQLLRDVHSSRCKISQDRENLPRRKAFFDYLPSERLELCLGIDAKYDRMRTDLDRSELLPADRELQRKVLLQQHEKEILDNLSESEAAEFRLRRSPNVVICSQLLDFTATQDELRGIVAILDQAGARLDQYSQELVPSKAVQPLTALLGPDRYTFFERNRDQRYLEASALAEKLHLPGSSAATLYGMQVNFENLASEIRQQAIDEDDRRDLLGALGSEASQKLGEFIGPEVQEKFTASDFGPEWVTRLSHLKP